MLELVIWLGVPMLVGIGAGIGRLSLTAEQKITRVRQERQRWRLYLWQRDIEANEGRCTRCEMRVLDMH